MAKKKKAKKVAKKKIKRVIVRKARKVKVKTRSKVKAAPKAKTLKEKMLGRVEHYFDKISVAAISVKAPFKVGDTIHIKGHTTDFMQTVDSMQIEHQNVTRVKKGDDVGIKVKEFVRDHDLVYLAPKGKGVVVLSAKPAVVQQPMFPSVPQKPISLPKQESKPSPPAAPTAFAIFEKKKSEISDPYEKTKFLKF